MPSNVSLLAAFNAFDRDHDGRVSIDELVRLLRKRGEKISRKEAEDALRRGDTDHDGQLSYDEFVAFTFGRA